MSTFATVLIKVQKGQEKNVKEWLIRKTKSPGESGKYCPDPECVHGIKAGNDGKICDKMQTLALAVIGGSYDLALVASVPDILVIENFIIDCLRNGEVGESITDTHSLYGTLVDR
jgi:hypothetical protein